MVEEWWAGHVVTKPCPWTPGYTGGGRCLRCFSMKLQPCTAAACLGRAERRAARKHRRPRQCDGRAVSVEAAYAGQLQAGHSNGMKSP